MISAGELLQVGRYQVDFQGIYGIIKLRFKKESKMAKEVNDIKKIRERLPHILGEVIELKKDIITLEIKDKEKAKSAWKDLTGAISEVTRKWKEPGAVAEIRDPREK